MIKDLGDREILFYYRDGCHLCTEMAAVLQYQWPKLYAQIQWRDVDSDKKWLKEFGELIPVLMVDQNIICKYVIEPNSIRDCFGDALNPV